MAWFHDLLLTADKMPDSPDYMLPAPHKKTVYQWYMTDHGEHPTVYPKVSSPYFLRVWREEFVMSNSARASASPSAASAFSTEVFGGTRRLRRRRRGRP